MLCQMQNPLGLQNFGNSCYLNAIVQMLRYVKPVVKRLVEIHSEDEVTQSFIDLLYQGSNPRKFVRHLKELGFNPIYQHDAHEFLLTMLDKIYEDPACNELKNPFEGHFESTLTCKNGHTSVSKEPFCCLSINGGLNEGIAKLEEPETVTCKCDHCEETEMTKTVTIHPAEVVCIQFKRFNIDGKLTYKVAIPEEWYGYKLIGIVNHMGSVHGGHYTAAVNVDGQYRHFNDEDVQDIDGLPKRSRVPYLMVYVSDK
jgi:ubiquitin C-terminal hydrolase